MDLVYEGYDRLHGSVSSQPVELHLQVPHSHAGATGTIGDAAVAVNWTIAANSDTHPDQPGTIEGTFAGAPVTLDGVFHIPDYRLHHADIAGTIGDQALTTRIVPAAGGFGSSSTVAADGTYGPVSFGLYAAINSSRTRAVIAGTIADVPTRLELAARRNRARTVRITGSYSGPLELLILLLAATLYFV